MQSVRIGLFALGTLSFIVSALFIGQEMGDILWRTGVAAMLVDLVFIRLYPAARNT
jgi:preprotein translocase subunit SecF